MGNSIFLIIEWWFEEFSLLWLNWRKLRMVMGWCNRSIPLALFMLVDGIVSLFPFMGEPMCFSLNREIIEHSGSVCMCWWHQILYASWGINPFSLKNLYFHSWLNKSRANSLYFLSFLSFCIGNCTPHLPNLMNIIYSKSWVWGLWSTFSGKLISDYLVK